MKEAKPTPRVERKLIIRRSKKGTEFEVGPSDYVGAVGVVTGITFAALLLAGMTNEATYAFSFLMGMGVTEGLRLSGRKRGRRR